jgi:hypothetical protein
MAFCFYQKYNFLDMWEIERGEIIRFRIKKSDVGRWKMEVGSQKSEVRSQKSEVRSQK